VGQALPDFSRAGHFGIHRAQRLMIARTDRTGALVLDVQFLSAGGRRDAGAAR
jgi:hypothetical protein